MLQSVIERVWGELEGLRLNNYQATSKGGSPLPGMHGRKPLASFLSFKKRRAMIARTASKMTVSLIVHSDDGIYFVDSKGDYDLPFAVKAC